MVSFFVGTLTHGLNCIPTTAKKVFGLKRCKSFRKPTIAVVVCCAEEYAGKDRQPVRFIRKPTLAVVVCCAEDYAGKDRQPVRFIRKPTLAVVVCCADDYAGKDHQQLRMVSFFVGTLTHGLNCIPTTAKKVFGLKRCKSFRKPTIAVVVCCAEDYAGKDRQPVRFIRKPTLAVVVCCAEDYAGKDHQQL